MPAWYAISCELIERFDPSAESYVPHLRYKLVHEAAYDADDLGESPVADLFRLERSESWDDVLVGVGHLEDHVGLDEPELRRAFNGWLVEVILPRLGANPAEIPKGTTLKELRDMLAERIDSWNEVNRQKAWQKGLQQGRKEERAGLLLLWLEKRFGPVDRTTREQIATADADLLLEWIENASTAASLAEVFSS